MLWVTGVQQAALIAWQRLSGEEISRERKYLERSIDCNVQERVNISNLPNLISLECACDNTHLINHRKSPLEELLVGFRLINIFYDFHIQSFFVYSKKNRLLTLLQNLCIQLILWFSPESNNNRRQRGFVIFSVSSKLCKMRFPVQKWHNSVVKHKKTTFYSKC